MTNQQIKEDFIQALFDRPWIYTRRINNTEIRTRCPFCGDSSKNQNTGHFYIHVNPEDNYPIQCYCFLCQCGGILQPSTLNLLDIDDVTLKSGVSTLCKTSDKIDKKGMINEVQMTTFDYKLPDIKLGSKTRYIEERLGLKGLPKEEFEKMKVITSLRDFCIVNKIKSLTCSNQIAFKLEEKYVGFLSYGNSHILFRDITNTEELRWIKYPITKESSANRIFYSMASEIDIFTKDEITINLAEGVLDILSANYNLGYDGNNILNLCVSGKYYDSLILFLVNLGFVGSNITINIFADNDHTFNKKNENNTTTIEYYQKILKNYKHLFGKIYVWYNLMSKDIGVPRDKIKLQRYQI
jgi:hypothetical protein